MPESPITECGGALAELVENLAATESWPACREILERETRLHAPAAVEHLYEETLRVAYRDLESAGRLARATQWLADLLGDNVSRAAGLRCAGHMHFAHARYQEALDCYSQALLLLEAEGPRLELEAGRTLATGLQVLIYLGRYDQAFQWADRARGIYERHHDELRLARLASNMGNIYFRQDRHPEAIALYRQAYPVLQDLGQPRDVAAVLSNMAVCYTCLSDFRAALDAYQQAREHCLKHGLDPLVAAADYNIAYLHYLRGEYGRAMDLYQKARLHCQKAGDAYHDALCDLDESEMYLELNLGEEGTRLAECAARKFEVLGMHYERAKAVVNQALGASQRGDAERALRLLRKGRRLFLAERNQAWPALIDLYSALLYHQVGRLAEAWRLAKQATKHLSPLLPAKAALGQLLIAQLLRQSGRYPEARTAALDAQGRLESAQSRGLFFYAHLALGQIAEDAGDLKAAWNAYQQARRASEDLLGVLRNERIQVSFLKDKLAVYESLVWLCLERERSPEVLAEAFQYIEEAKSRKLADLVACPMQDAVSSTDAGGAADRIGNLRWELEWHYRQMELAALRPGAASALQFENLRRHALERETELVQRTVRFRSEDRERAVLQGVGHLSLDQIRALIPADAMLLQYFQLRGTIWVCLLNRERLEIVPLHNASGVRQSLCLLQFQMAKYRLGAAYLDRLSATWRAATEAHLRELYRQIMAPIRGRLEAAHLIVAPQGFLHYLPFHALHDGTGFLMDDYTLSYAPSGSVFALCCSREAAFENRALVIGVPDPLARGIEQEARRVASILPNARLLFGEQASRQALREEGRGCRYVHIATHGMFRSDNPMFSSIRLGDGYLSLFDLYDLPLSAGLVTLSGCSTGLSVVVGGDELFGLMRGLLSAGAHSVLASLWDVYDRSTTDFMSAFYRHVRHQDNRSWAVREAMREVRDQYPHPFYWSPFVLVGKYRNGEYGLAGAEEKIRSPALLNSPPRDS
jgi:CHAT domain-containing protein/tetratricopeptide (TPR) repeat protein